jgi:hypothetical protein
VTSLGLVDAGGGGGTGVGLTFVPTPVRLGYSPNIQDDLCSQVANETVPRALYYVDLNSGLRLQTATQLVDSNLNQVPDGIYSDGTYFAIVQQGVLQPAIECPGAPPPPPGLTLYEAPSLCTTLGQLSTDSRTICELCYRDQEGITFPVDGILYPFYIDTPSFTSATKIYRDRSGSIPIPQGGQFTETSTRAVRIVIDNEGTLGPVSYCQNRYYDISKCTAGTPEEGGGFGYVINEGPDFFQQRILINGELWFYTTSGPNGSLNPNPNRIQFTRDQIVKTSAIGCGGGGTGGPPPAPTTVQKRLFETIRPSLQSAFNAQCAAEDFNQAAFQPGIIRVNGEEVGRGDVTVTFTIGEEYVIEFELPSHPSFDFSIGNNIVRFTATTDNSPIEAIVVPTFIPSTAVLNVSTNFSPSIGSGTGGVIINLSGKGKIGVDQVRGYELTEGTYTISFEPIQVPGMLFVTPREQVITITSKDFCKTYNITGTFVGVPLPKGFWLKEFDGSEQSKLRAQFTKGMFSNNIGNMVNFYSSSISDSLDNHYTHVYHEPSGSATASIQFSLAYGHYNGSGSNDLGGQYMDTPTRAIYGQYRSIVTEGAQKLNLTGTETEHFYVLSYQKDRRDTRADYRALEINLAHLSGSEFINGTGSMATHTGSNVTLGGLGKVLRLTSDYSINDEPDVTPLQYNIVSGSVEDGVYNSTSPHYYGKVYPSLGLVLLDANKLDASASFGTVTSREIDGKNQLKLFTAISGAAQYTDQSGDLLGMKARATKEELNLYYFIHVRNREFNLSNNPSYFNTTGLQFLKYGIPNNVKVDPAVLDATGIVDEQFQLKPKTYITTIGLYNEHRELVAVGKISRPEIKSFTDEVMYTVKIKY